MTIQTNGLGIGLQTTGQLGTVSGISDAAKESAEVKQTEETKTAATSTLVKDDGTAVSKDGDTLSISAQGQSAAQSLSSQATGDTATESGSASAVSAVASGTSTASTATASASTGAGVVSATLEEDDEDEDSDSSDLSTYSESELRTMLNNGEITQAEYNAEIESRSETDDSGSSASKVVISEDSLAGQI